MNQKRVIFKNTELPNFINQNQSILSKYNYSLRQVLDRRSNHKHLVVECKDQPQAERLYWEFIDDGVYVNQRERRRCVQDQDAYNFYLIEVGSALSSEVMEIDQANGEKASDDDSGVSDLMMNQSLVNSIIEPGEIPSQKQN